MNACPSPSCSGNRDDKKKEGSRRALLVHSWLVTGCVNVILTAFSPD